MAIKMLGDGRPWHGCYQLIASMKYRRKMLMDEGARERLSTILQETAGRMPGTKCIALTVAYDHIHVLLQSTLDPPKTAKRLLGASSRLMRKEYPELAAMSPKGLWGGCSCVPIMDEWHLCNCASYILRHRPDNSKTEVAPLLCDMGLELYRD